MSAVLAFLRRELGAHWGYLVLALLLVVVDVLDRAVFGLASTTMLDEWELFQPDGSAPYVIIYAALAVALGQSLLAAELDQRTIAFVDALPTTRLHAFAGKALLAIAVVLSGPVLTSVAGLALHAASRTSLEPALHGDVVMTALLVWTVSAVALTGFGFAVSFLRGGAWLAAVLVGFGLGFGRESWPELDLINPMFLVEPTVRGTSWPVPWKAVAAQLLAGLALLAVAAALFAGPGQRLAARFAPGSRLRRATGFLVVGAAATGVTTLALLLSTESATGRGRIDGPSAPEIDFYAAAAEEARTARWHISYPAELAARARVLVDEGDALHDRVTALLAAEPLESIALDATAELGSSGLHGLAEFRTARVALREIEDAERMREVLRHETAHVYVGELSDRRARDRYGATRFVNEGLATWVTHRLAPSDEEARASMLHAAVLYARERPRLQELLDDDELRARLDADVVYPLGAAFVHAAARACGEGAIPKAFRALAEPAVAEIADEEALWRAALAQASCSFDDVANEWARSLLALREQRAREIAEIPAPRYRAVRAGVDVVVTATEGALPEGAECRLRADRDDDEETWLELYADDGECRARASRFPRGALDVQIGFYVPALRATLWSGWRRFHLDEDD